MWNYSFLGGTETVAVNEVKIIAVWKIIFQFYGFLNVDNGEEKKKYK